MDFKDLSSYVLAIARYQNITKLPTLCMSRSRHFIKFLQNLSPSLVKSYSGSWVTVLSSLAGERYVEKASEILNLKKELDQR